jgi:hypothetical protein
LFDIAYSPEPTGLLQRLLDRASFPFGDRPSGRIEAATALVEQSLSDFGDADAILLLDRSGSKTAVFVEAKVEPSQARRWTIDEEFAAFRQGIETRVSSSNLFTQLYHKIRFAHAAASADGIPRAGVRFPTCSRKPMRKIGSNPVVHRAVKRITPYLDDVFYVALVPDETETLERFVEQTLRAFVPPGFDGWDVTRLGFLPWSQVYAFCGSEGLDRARGVLDFNEGQIWKSGQQFKRL